MCGAESPHPAAGDAGAPGSVALQSSRCQGEAAMDWGTVISSTLGAMWGLAVAMLVPHWWWLTPVIAAAVVLAWPARIPVRTNRYAPERTWRTFKFGLRRAVFERAGNRCEQHNLFGARCGSPAQEADHLWPFSRGGATVLGNGQALCQFHNRSKRASPPRWWELRYLLRGRRRYAPPGVEIEPWR